MEIIAKVFDWKITRTELDLEEKRIRKHYPDALQSEIRSLAVSQLIDRYLLMQEAMNRGILVGDDEFEVALLDMIDYLETPEASVLVNRKDRGEQIENFLKANLFIRKLISSLNIGKDTLTEKKLYQFYKERKDYFFKDEEVRASHILLKGKNDKTYKQISDIRKCINCANDFADFSKHESDCPSGMNCGDLGYFPRGRMVPEIEQVAFSMNINEISQPFQTKYGYHILMVTDIRRKQSIPFEEIKDSLKESLIDIEEDIALNRILSDVRERCQDDVKIFEHAFE